MIFVAKIHNNSLGACIPVNSYDEGIDLIKGMAVEQLNRELTDEEIDDVINSYELYNDEDSDNIYTWSVGIMYD